MKKKDNLMDWNPQLSVVSGDSDVSGVKVISDKLDNRRGTYTNDSIDSID